MATANGSSTNGTDLSRGHAVDYTPLAVVERTAEQLASLEGCIWFDIDNCLYSKSLGIAKLMSQKIHEYFLKLGIPEKEAWDLHLHYYTNYGLAIRGLQRHHPEFDAEDFDRSCDGALPLEEIMSEDLALQDLLKSIDRSKVRVMALTNAYRPHALRVLSILGVRDLFEGVISCQYRTPQFPAKPDSEYFQAVSYDFPGNTTQANLSDVPPHQAMDISEIPDPSKHYFIDDSLLNVKGATARGWHAWLFDEEGHATYDKASISGCVRSLEALREVWQQFFVNE